jgi:hypothetical protein
MHSKKYKNFSHCEHKKRDKEKAREKEVERA